MPKRGLTSRRPRPLDRSIGVLRDARLFVVATEGEKTEEIYFDAFRSTKIQIEVLPTEGGYSAPKHVFSRLQEFQAKYDLGEGDELWLVVDVDRWKSAQLRHVCSGCRSKGVGVCVSNPCFEAWLYLHLAEAPKEPHTSKEIEGLLRKRLGSYSKTHYDVETLLGGVEDAISRAKTLHANARERWPATFGSHVYRLVEKLLPELSRRSA